jgi:hypothetical protein
MLQIWVQLQQSPPNLICVVNITRSALVMFHPNLVPKLAQNPLVLILRVKRTHPRAESLLHHNILKNSIVANLWDV